MIKSYLKDGNESYATINGVKWLNEINLVVKEYINHSLIEVTAYYDKNNYDEIRDICLKNEIVIVEIKNISTYICKFKESEIQSNCNEIVTCKFTFISD
jgi:hypothetical protein